MLFFTDSVRYKDCAAAAKEQLALAMGHLDELYRRQRAYLAAFWSAQSCRCRGTMKMPLPSVLTSTSCYRPPVRRPVQRGGEGLSVKGMRGTFFGIPRCTFCLFSFFTDPSLAKKLLHFRYLTLDAARENAKLLGHRAGALYPWRTIAGRECSGWPHHPVRRNTTSMETLPTRCCTG